MQRCAVVAFSLAVSLLGAGCGGAASVSRVQAEEAVRANTALGIASVDCRKDGTRQRCLVILRTGDCEIQEVALRDDAVSVTRIHEPCVGESDLVP